MKQGTLITRIVVLVLAAAVMAYIGFAIWQGVSDPYQTVISYAYEMDDGVSLEGLVVREEQAIFGETALAEVLPQEGEKVAVGAPVAAVYASEAALQSHREAKSLELQLEQLNYAMRRNDTVGDVSQLDWELVDTLAQLRSGVSTGELGDLEDDGLALRSLVLKRTGDAATSAESLAAIQAAAAELEGRLARLNATAAQQTRYISVGQSGTFSGLADGYESVLTPESLENMTVQSLDKLLSGEPTPPSGAVGKLVTDSTWYFATAVNGETAKRLEVGSRYTVAFTGDFRQDVTMRLERLGTSEGGRQLAVFSSSRYLSQVTLARKESATLVFQRYTGVRVPAKALRVRDNDDGSTTLGVYTLVGRQAEFKPVEIVREGDGFYLLKGTATNRKVLRPGDVLVLSNQPLYDGKVVAK